MFTRDASGAALLGGIPLRDLLRSPETFGGAPHGLRGPLPTPCYVHDLGASAAALRALQAGLDGPGLVAYAVKASSAAPIVRRLRAEGAGAEVVSGGELALALRSGVGAEDVLMSGVAKQDWELDAALGAGDRGILAVQMESVEEIARVAARARALGRRARVSLRVNPGVLADTHAGVATGHDEAKFGIARADLPDAFEALAAAGDRLELQGLSCHVGSQLLRTDEALAAADVLLAIAAERRLRLSFLDFGGGFGVDYGAGAPAAAPADFAAAFSRRLRGSPLAAARLVVEPGRALVAPFAVLLARVVQTKTSRGTPGGDLVPVPRRWTMIDAGMNDLVRPAMYGARHRVEALEPAPGVPEPRRVVGPVCESSDDFGEHLLTGAEPAVAVRDAGAYGVTMASEYNARPVPLEVFVEDGAIRAALPGRSVEDWLRARGA